MERYLISMKEACRLSLLLSCCVPSVILLTWLVVELFTSPSNYHDIVWMAYCPAIQEGEQRPRRGGTEAGPKSQRKRGSSVEN